MTNSFISQLILNLKKIDSFKRDLIAVNSNIDTYISSTGSTIRKLSSSKIDLNNILYSMKNDLDTLDVLHGSLSNSRANLYYNSISSLNNIENYADTVQESVDVNTAYYGRIIKSQSQSASNLIESYNSNSIYYLGEMNQKISDYRTSVSKGKSYVTEIDLHISELKNTKTNLQNYKTLIKQKEQELDNINKKFIGIESFDPNSLLEPIKVENLPVYRLIAADKYKSEYAEESQTTETVEKGFSMVSLQTMFPTIFFVMLLFLSILISNFTCLQSVNSSSNKRMRLIKGVFVHDLISIYISSFLIIFLPLVSMLFVGHYVFMIPILENAFPVIIIGFLVTSIFIFLGAGLAYLIRKKSITLLVTTFVLIFLLFLSGFLYPIERMSKLVSYFALNMPSKIAITAFNKVTFYSQNFSSIFLDILFLSIWLVLLIIAVVLIKFIREKVN